MISAMPRLDGGGAAWGLMRVRQTKTDTLFMAQIWKKRPPFLRNIFLQNIPFFQMTFLNNFIADCNVMDERRTVHIPFLLYIKKYAYVYISSLHNNASGSKKDNFAIHLFTFIPQSA